MIINLILWSVALYLCFGFVFALVFILKGLRVVDVGAHDSSVGFKIIIIPGTMVFWPVLLKKWIEASKIQPHD
jgi:hypothetical protein